MNVHDVIDVNVFNFFYLWTSFDSDAELLRVSTCETLDFESKEDK